MKLHILSAVLKSYKCIAPVYSRALRRVWGRAYEVKNVVARRKQRDKEKERENFVQSEWDWKIEKLVDQRIGLHVHVSSGD